MYDFYYDAKEKKDNPTISLKKEEEETRRRDYEEILGMKAHHKDQHNNWSKAGNFYNIVQSGEGLDGISRYAIGLSRTVIDTGISMINEGEPEGAFKPLTPSDRKINVLWDALVKHVLNKSNWRTHQKLFTTDIHIFGTSVLEAFINPVLRRPNEDPALFLIRLAKTARTGLRHRSIWKVFRNPYVADPNDVQSGAWEEVITHAAWTTRYAGRKDFKNQKMIPVASKYKLTYIANELENTFRMYCLPFGKMAEAYYEEMPSDNEMGVPVCEKKLTDVNPLGMVPMSFGILNDQLTPDYKEHSLYGMGIPQLIEGMELIQEGLFNMTIDNMRLKNTVVVGYQPYSGSTDYPDIDNIGIMDSGRVMPGQFNPQSLGVADLQSNQVLWEWINNQCIWLTGYNFQQLGGDTSKTAYEFAQRLKANSNRALARLKGLETTTMKRSWIMLLANTLSQIKEDEWAEITGKDAESIAELISSGEVSTNDYKVENGVVKSKRFVEYFEVPDHETNENFSNSKKRIMDSKSTNNTLEIREKKGASGMVPAVGEYLFPKGRIAEMMAFTVEINSKTMLGDLRVKDSEAISRSLATGVNLMPVVKDITPQMIYQLWKQDAENSGLDIDSVTENTDKSEAMQAVEDIIAKMEAQNEQEPQPMAPVGNIQPTQQEEAFKPPMSNLPVNA